MSKKTERKKSEIKKPEVKPIEMPDPKPEEQAEFSPGFLRWLITLTVATLILVFFIERGTMIRPFSTDFRISPQPWITAAGITIQEGLLEFHGKGGSKSYEIERYSILGCLLIVFILGPTLLLFAWRSSLKQKEGKQKILHPWNIAFVLGGISLLPVALPAIPAAIMQRLVSQEMRSTQAVAEAKDAMMHEMSLISFEARQFKARPFSMGGGGGSYFGYNISPERATSEHGTYITIEVGEDQIVFKGTSALYPASNITVILDSAGAMKHWAFGGNF